MKLKTVDLKALTSLFKAVEDKDKTISLQVKEGRLIAETRADGNSLKLMRIKTDEKDTEKITIKKDFLHKIEKLNAEEIEIKINKRTVSSKVKGMNFNTTILDENTNHNVGKTVKKDGIKFLLSNEVIGYLVQAKEFVDRTSKRGELQGVNFKLEENAFYIGATNGFKMYYNKVENDLKDKFNIILRPESIDALNSISEAFGKQDIPIEIAKGGIFIDTKVLYYESVFIERAFPDIKVVLGRAEKLKPIFKHNFTEQEIDNLKLISIRAPYLQIEKKESEFVEFIVSNQTETNSFMLVPEQETEDFLIHVNLQEMITSLQMIPEITINENMVIFSSNNQKILLNKMRVESKK